jgi:ribosomal protein S18 acetylase RimI-like enzyme
MENDTSRKVGIELPRSLRVQGFALRPEREADDTFLIALYASTRAHEMAMLTDWTAEQKQTFIAQQFAAQRFHYRTRLADCRFDVLERDGDAVGRLYTQETTGQLRIIDVALIPALRGQGVGTAILRHVLAGADRSALPVGLFVEPYNPALQLYRRLGFEQVAESDFYIEMERPCRLETGAEIS